MKQVPTRAVNVALLAATAFSVLSVLIFLIYLAARIFALGSGDFLQRVIIAGIVVAGIGQVMQFLAVAIVLVAWFTLKTMPRKRHEMIVLFLSLIPFVPVIILLIVAFLYLRARLMKHSKERQKELLDLQLDTTIDAAATLANALESPTSLSASTAVAGHTSVHAIVRSVVGPVTSESLGKTPMRALGALTVASVVALSAAGLGATQLPRAPQHVPTGTIHMLSVPLHSYVLPQNNLLGFGGITQGPDGNMWVTSMFGPFPSVFSITTSGHVTQFPRAGGRGITTGPDGNLWYLTSDGVVRMTLSGASKTFSTPPNELTDMTRGADGNLWFGDVESGSKMAIVRITPSGVIHKFTKAFPSAFPAPKYLTQGPDGNVWFTVIRDESNAGNMIGRITPTGAITLFPLPDGNWPSGITTGPDGNLWFADGDAIGRITPAGVIKKFPLSALNVDNNIVWGPDGNLWFTAHRFSSTGQFLENAIGRMTPTGALTTINLPSDISSGTDSVDICVGTDGYLWFVDYLSGKIGWIAP